LEKSAVVLFLGLCPHAYEEKPPENQKISARTKNEQEGDVSKYVRTRGTVRAILVFTWRQHGVLWARNVIKFMEGCEEKVEGG
jgi:hypothetical protein